MGLFDRFKKKPEADTPQWPQPPRADTMCLVLMDRVLEDIEPAATHLKEVFGAEAVGAVDRGHPIVSSFSVTIEGLEFWVSYLAMPVPPDTADIATASKYALLLSEEEKAAFAGHRSFWMLAQKGGGTSLAEKRRACWVFSLLCAALMELEGTVGATPVNRGGLLVSRRHYLQQREMMEGKTWDNKGGFFPAPLWVWVYGTTSDGGKPVIQTQGLDDFGLLELGFFDPERPVNELLDLLYAMSCLQITERQLYRNMALVPLDEKTEAVCKQDGNILLFIGA